MKLLRPAKLNDREIYVHDFESHIPVLCQTLKEHEGECVLEVGCGLYSTPILFSHAKRFEWLVQDVGWASVVRQAVPGLPDPVEVDFDYTGQLEAKIAELKLPRNTYVFMDYERPPAERRPVLDVLLRHFDRVTIHDANWVPLAGLEYERFDTMHPACAVIKSSPDWSSRENKPLARRWELITAYTPDYEDKFETLKASCDRLGLSLIAYEIADRGTWVKNCAAKPEVILKAMENAEGEYVVWTDADSTVEQYPVLFDEFGGICAVHYRSVPVPHLCSGTMIFHCKKALPLVRRWISAQRIRPGEWDQRVLERVIRDVPHARLPAAYCCIFDAPDHLGDCPNGPVFLHGQASREKKAAEKSGR